MDSVQETTTRLGYSNKNHMSKFDRWASLTTPRPATPAQSRAVTGTRDVGNLTAQIEKILSALCDLNLYDNRPTSRPATELVVGELVSHVS
ncbi:hypothetical protein EVAR_25297_1 [Eumeta japonica]|uniref:Uncharacterized protein n=1 Tax=Eumeta variegata TaxID=151549 RepID=A0A4C1VRK8_EUMVA|nr:hypothetical protein EVAR_25297_1 [Eumeta japonica]